MLTTLKPTDFVGRTQPTADADEQKIKVPKSVADWFHARVLRGRKEVFSETIDLTPEVAKLLLHGNDDNRRVNPNTLSTYIADMKFGRWSLNGESLKVSTDGLLNDGQHRCWAVAESGVTVRTLITFGVARDSRMTLDQGKSRSTADYLAMEAGVKYAAAVTAAARVLLVRRLGYSSDLGAKAGITRLAVRAEYWANQRALDASAHFVLGKHSGIRVLGGASAAVAALALARKESANADDFMSKFIRGNDLPDGDPILTLRTRFANTPKLPQVTRLSMLMRAFDAWMEGRTMRSIPAKTRKAPKQRGK